MINSDHTLQQSLKGYRSLISVWTLVDRMLRSSMSRQQKRKARQYQQMVMMSSSCPWTSVAQYPSSDKHHSKDIDARVRDF